MSFLLLVAESMLKTLIWSDPLTANMATIEISNSCGKCNRMRSHTIGFSINKTLLLNDTKLKNNVGNNKCASVTNISLFLISYLNGLIDRKYVFFYSYLADFTCLFTTAVTVM